MELGLPEEWKGWTLSEKIGEGSFGTVFKACCTSGQTEKISAIKIIDIPQDKDELESVRREYDSEESVQAYFDKRKQDILREAEWMLFLKDTPNIVQLEDYFVEGTGDMSCRIYLRMEYLQDFRTRSSEQKMSYDEIVKIALDMCSALISCEAHGILHRDIKPGNILYSPEEDAYKLGDFGSSRKEEVPGDFSSEGTLSYMAPEVYMGHTYGKNADIYSLGITLYRLLNRNCFPFENVYRKEIPFCERETALLRRLSGENLPEPIDADEGLSKIIMRACAFNPKERYQNALEMKGDLLRLADLREVQYA